MSKIIDQLRQAEEQRERFVAERKRFEAEADAALAAREREERRLPPAAPTRLGEPAAASRAAPPARSPQQQSRVAAAVAIAAAMAVVFWVGTLVSRPPAAPDSVPRVPETALRAPDLPAAPALFRLDRDLDAFAARLREKGRE